jgi:hypothetical protein
MLEKLLNQVSMPETVHTDTFGARAEKLGQITITRATAQW